MQQRKWREHTGRPTTGNRRKHRVQLLCTTKKIEENVDCLKWGIKKQNKVETVGTKKK